MNRSDLFSDDDDDGDGDDDDDHDDDYDDEDYDHHIEQLSGLWIDLTCSLIIMTMTMDNENDDYSNDYDIHDDHDVMADVGQDASP